MKLSQLFKTYQGKDVEITGISTNTKTIKNGDLFVCIKGAKVDRHNFIDEAIKKGASALVVSKTDDYSVPYVLVDDTNEILQEIYSSFYGHPENKLTLIGVTGTDGKTSTATTIQKLLGNDICGYIGTNGYSCYKFNKETDNTTPGIDSLYGILDEFVQAGCKYVAMETSSEAVYYKRLKNIKFTTGVLTNIDKEHLNTHKTLENYIDCKKQLFRQAKKAILNSKDKYFDEFKEIDKEYASYGYKPEDTLYIENYEISPNNTIINYQYHNQTFKVTSPLLGQFNIENLSAALLVGLCLGFDFDYLINNLPGLAIDGRMQSINLGQDFYVLVDYAHTPNGLRRLFEFTNKLKVNKRIVVTGNAGERDASKRKDVGFLCADNNDKVIFCYEDPRFEDPMNIINDLTTLIHNYSNYEIIIDREEAINKAIMEAEPNDLVMILGKGNEDWEEIRGEYLDFNDVEKTKEAILKKIKINS